MQDTSTFAPDTPRARLVSDPQRRVHAPKGDPAPRRSSSP